MKIYLEFKDEKSNKFWEVSIKDNTHTVRYGKIGAKGTSKTKEFDSNEAAIDDAHRLAETKMDKGYEEADNLSPNLENSSFSIVGPELQIITADEWRELGKYFPTDDFEYVVYFKGDVHIKESLTPDWCGKLLEELDIDGVLIHIDGNLTVDGEISPAFDHTDTHLLVSGDVKCDQLTSGDETIVIEGHAHIKYVLVGDYNDGHIGIYKMTYVPFVVNRDHSTCVNLEDETIVLCSFGSGDEMMDYHFVKSEFPEVMIDEVMPNGQFNLQRFIKVLKRGDSPLKEGIKIEKKHLM